MPIGVYSRIPGRKRGPYHRKSLAERFWPKVAKSDGCWEWQGARAGVPPSHLYGVINAGGAGGHVLLAHRVSWELHNGPIPAGMIILHICDNPPCVRPDHLRLGTMSENQQDCTAKQRRPAGASHPSRIHPERLPRGERHPNAKLTDAQASAIRVRHAAGGITQTALAREYGVHPSVISTIVNNRVHMPPGQNTKGRRVL